MKQSKNYYKIKWISFFITVGILGLGLIGLLLWSRAPAETPGPIQEQQPILSEAGHYSNAAFSQLLDQNLKELGFLSNIHFQGTDEGRFSISGTLADAERLMAACPEIRVYKVLLQALEGESIALEGHLGEAENGNGRMIADSLTFADYHIPAGAATPYIEQYTSVNDLFAVPFREITLNQSGITFSKELPTIIQTA